MKKILCIVQQHMFSKSEIQEMEAGFREIYNTHYTKEKVKVLWMIMPEGYAYSERKPSNAAVIMFEVAEDISKTKREELMNLVSQFLMKNYSISPLDAVITMANSSFVNAFLEAQKNRIRPSARPLITLKQMYTALTSKLINGYLRLRVKY